MPHFDVLVKDEAEKIWPEFLKNWVKGEIKDCYVQEDLIDLELFPKPKWELLPIDQYLAGIFQTSRGCPPGCEFCDVTALFGRRFRHKSIDQVMAERISLFCWTLRLIKIYLFSPKSAHLKLFISILQQTATKSIICLPLALNALAYFWSLDDYVKRNF